MQNIYLKKIVRPIFVAACLSLTILAQATPSYAKASAWNEAYMSLNSWSGFYTEPDDVANPMDVAVSSYEESYSSAKSYCNGVLKKTEEMSSDNMSFDTWAEANYRVGTGSAYAASAVTASSDPWLLETYLGVSSNKGGNFVGEAQAYHRWYFTVTGGSGYVYSDIRYNFTQTMDETRARPLDLTSAATIAEIYLTNNTTDKFFYKYDPLWTSEGDGPLNDSKSLNGKLSSWLYFNEGDTGTLDIGLYSQSMAFSAAPVPEPSILLLMGSGLLGLVGLRKKK